MLFNSLEFAFFLPIVFLLYWFLTPSGINGPRYSLFHYWHVSEQTALNIQNAFVLVASYVFYGWWDWRFLLLIAFTSFCSWGSGLLIGRSLTRPSLKGRRLISPRFWMIANIVLNLGILAVFKYYDFFVSEFGQLFGISTDSLLLRIILPVGISFYTFQALSYSIDVYRQKIEPTKDIIAFFAFIAFFPQLVAGPIERATNLLPQFLQKRTFSYDQATDGMRQILWGLFKKIVVADNCATYVDQVWATYDTQTGSTLLLAAILFTFQIYGDFSGYSDIAIGTAKLFGIKLMRNFNNPYFSRDIAEFWRRWHISLTTWFRDYVYIPLGGSRPEVPAHIQHPDRYKKLIIIRNTFVIFLLSGFWHGANWTFIAWGAYHALLFLPLILLGKNRKYTNQVAEGRFLPTWKETFQILCTFLLAVFGWIIFRAETITQAWEYICGIFTQKLLCGPYLINLEYYIPLACALTITMVMEWFNRAESHGLAINKTINIQWIRRIIYFGLVLFIIYYGRFSYNQFIYFQF
ncbi:MAG: MBOAT family protein [Paludibacteraceae bacterium]|nr:MBOAT family protein [Paludibacteraceae bacterium]MDD6748171.1 MBOAT family protein [Paludibacteraceae bacterium]